jgi:hypothetical protein
MPQNFKYEERPFCFLLGVPNDDQLVTVYFVCRYWPYMGGAFYPESPPVLPF